MDNRLIAGLLIKAGGIMGALVLVSALGGCIDKEKNPITELAANNVNENNITLVDKESTLDAGSLDQNASMLQYASNTSRSKQNMIRLILRPNELYRTGKLPITLKIINSSVNETVLTVFKPEFGSEWYNQTNITYVEDHNWTQNYSLKPLNNTSYVTMFVQIIQNGTIVKKAAWNITFDAPIGRPK